jgi:hypothetical protein
MSGSVNAPFGMRPVEHWNGNPWNGATRILVSETSNDALYIGDPLYRVVADATEITGRYMAVDQLTGAGVVDGVDDQIVGVMMSRAGQSFAAGAGGVGELLQSDLVYIPADTDAALLNACVDQSVVFLMQTDSTMVYTDCGKNTTIISGSGSTSTGLSGFVLDGDAAAANNAHHVVIIGLWDDPVNLVGDQYSLWLVYLNIPWLAVGGYSSVTGTLGV